MGTDANKVLLFDFWGLIGVVQAPESVAAMAQRLRVPVQAFTDTYWRYREAHDAGGSASDFWAEVADDLGVALDEQMLRDLIEIDVESWSGVHTDMLELIAELQEQGRRLALLSNAPRDLVEHASSVLAGLVSELLFSCDLGVAKPEPEAFELAVQRLRVRPGDVIFVDDNRCNVRAAKAAGMTAFQHVSVAQTRSTLALLLI